MAWIDILKGRSAIHIIPFWWLETADRLTFSWHSEAKDGGFEQIWFC
jgi:hypothetical protein